MKPSPQYHQALAASKQHHSENKTFSGMFLRPHAPYIDAIIRRRNVRSVLDYGCGKGRQYEWINHATVQHEPEHKPFYAGQTIEQYWGVPVQRYDPAYAPFAPEPQGFFDLVICTHTLGAIPKVDHAWVIGRLFALASKAVYIAEKIGVPKKQIYQPEAMAIGWEHEQWREAIRPHLRDGIEAHLATRTRGANGVQVRREQLA